MPDNRTVDEVLEQRRHAAVGGCCNRFADMQGCDCLENARMRAVHPGPPKETRKPEPKQSFTPLTDPPRRKIIRPDKVT